MPVKSCGKGKWKIGHGKCIYDSKAKAHRAYLGYLGSKYGKVAKGGSQGMIEPKLSFFVPIQKFDEEQRMVYGVATCETLDKQNEVVDYAATKEALNDYSNWRNIREMHKPSAVGIAPVLELRDNSKELYIGAKIVDDAAWQKCKEGVYKGFSIGGEVLDRRIELNKTTGKQINRITKYVMNEISVVDRPANPSCVFQTVKRDTSIETVTISDDPLLQESARVMEKAVLLSKRVLSKTDLVNLPDSAFGLIKVVSDGEKLIKHRMYPMPDKVHAINMVRKSIGDDITDEEKIRVHDSALLVLGKKHTEAECPFCIKQKLEGGATVSKESLKKGSVVITHEPEKKTVTVDDGKDVNDIEGKPTVDAGAKTAPVAPADAPVAKKPADEQKPHIKVDEEPVAADVAPASDEPAGNDINAKLDRLIGLLEDLLAVEQTEGEVEGEEQPMEDEMGYEEDTKASDTVPVDELETGAKQTEKPIEEEEEEDEECKADMKPAEEEEEDECADEETMKVTKAEKKPAGKAPMKKGVLGSLIKKRVSALIEPLQKENAELKAQLQKMSKQPLPRKDGMAKSEGPVKVEKYPEVKLEKREVEFDEALQKDISKAIDLRKSGKALNADEQAFCQRVAEKMLEVKAQKKA